MRLTKRINGPIHRQNDEQDFDLWEIDVIKKLAAYEDAEEQGRLVILPCKVGDTVYVVKNVVSRGYPDPIITKQIFEEKFRYEHLNFSQNVYLTYEEAEIALEGEGTE